MSAPKIPAAPVKGRRSADTWPRHKAKARGRAARRPPRKDNRPHD